jgi:hypothetical protein
MKYKSEILQYGRESIEGRSEGEDETWEAGGSLDKTLNRHAGGRVSPSGDCNLPSSHLNRPFEMTTMYFYVDNVIATVCTYAGTQLQCE